jgi:flagellar biosynthesis GTPase FlhF
LQGRVQPDGVALAPKMPLHTCRCRFETCPNGLEYDYSGYKFVSEPTLYLDRYWKPARVPLYELHCPNMAVACCIKYSGTADGIFMLSKTQGVPLRFLHLGLTYFLSSAMPPASFYAFLKGDSCDFYVPDHPQEKIDFFSENTWRDIFFLFLCCIALKPPSLEQPTQVQASQQRDQEEGSFQQQQQHDSLQQEEFLQQEQQAPTLLQQREDSVLLNQQEQDGELLEQQRQQLEDLLQQQQQQQQEVEEPSQQQQQEQQEEPSPQQQQPEPALPVQQQAPLLRFKCAKCGNNPKVLVVDGTYAAFEKGYYSGTSITTRCEGLPEVKRETTKIQRSFFNNFTVTARKKLVDQVNTFAGLLEKGGEPATPAGPHPLDIEQDQYSDLKTHTVLATFLRWIRANVANQRLNKEQKDKLAVFLSKNIATDSPVLAYFPWRLVALVKPAVEPDAAGVLSVSVIKEVAKGAPWVFKVLETAGASRRRAFTLPAEFKPLLAELCARAERCVEGPGIEVVPVLANRGDPSVFSDDCITSGVCSGLPQLRERPKFEIDKDDKDDKGCRKNFQAGADRTGGVMTIFCGHGVCYSSFIIQESESRDHLFSFMVKYLEKPPDFLIYDFGCAALDYCLNRLPGWFKAMVVLIDRFHWANHTSCCCSFNMRFYDEVSCLNSQIAEQCNSHLKKINPSLRRSSQPFFMAMLRAYLDDWNAKKNQSLVDSLDRCDEFKFRLPL